MVRFARLGRRRPQHASIWTVAEWLVMKVSAEQAKLPELIGDVFADVGHRSVGTDDDLFPLFVFRVLIRLLARSLESGARSPLSTRLLILNPHDPASSELA